MTQVELTVLAIPFCQSNLSETCVISGSQLDTARKRFGTDEDIIWIDAIQTFTAVTP